jgi:hypothetical protein
VDSTVLASLIGGVSTVVATFISPIITNRINERKKAKYVPSAPITRQNALYGMWDGSMDQKIGIGKVCNIHKLKLIFDDGTNPMMGHLYINFKITNDEIIIPPDNSIEAKVINTLYDGRIMKIDYVNKDNNVVHFGTLYGELSADGKEINGEFLGYGLESEQFVSGKINLKKKKMA